jgi:beta-hydroxylase
MGRSWRDGQAMLFDETYVHEACNGTDVTRLILFCDVERPGARLMTPVNHWVMRHGMGATSTQKEAGEPIGAINRFYGRHAGIIAAGKALKARNRALYYVITNALIVGVVALFLAP